MNVAMRLSITAFVVTAVLVSSLIAAPLMTDTKDSQIEAHRYALNWLREYEYLEEKAATSCEICIVQKCPDDCLDKLKETIREPLMRFQKFFSFEETGILTTDHLEKMAQPRCGDPDAQISKSRIKRWSRLGQIVWPKEFMPLQISVAGGTRDFSVQDVEEIALECARLWAEPSSLSFQLAPRGRKGNIDIRFEYIDGQWNTVGLGLSPVTWGDKSSYLKLDRDELWKRDTKTRGFGVSLKWAVCHEMGHNLGLSHSTDRRALMYPSGIGQDETRLPTDDYNGITYLYRGRDGKTVFGRARPTPRPTTRRTTTRRQNTRRPVTRTPTTRRPPAPRPRPTTRRPFTRPPATRAPAPTTKHRPPTHYRTYRPPSNRRFAPPGHTPRYRPSATTRKPTPAPPAPPANYWYFDATQDRWVYSG